MEIRLFSDLHVDHGKFKFNKVKNVKLDQILVLAGDLGNRFAGRNTIEEACTLFKEVFFIPGNHEYVGAEYQYVNQYWKELESKIDNLHVLINDTVIIDDVRFIGATMWTDMNKNDWFTIQNAKRVMPEFKFTKYNRTGPPIHRRCDLAAIPKFTVDDSMKLFAETMAYFEEKLREEFDGKTIIVTHHMPSHNLIHPIYQNSNVNGAFAGNADHLMSFYKIDYWFYGHTHHQSNRLIYNTQAVCNPKGYAGYESERCDYGLVIDV